MRSPAKAKHDKSYELDREGFSLKLGDFEEHQGGLPAMERKGRALPKVDPFNGSYEISEADFANKDRAGSGSDNVGAAIRKSELVRR